MSPSGSRNLTATLNYGTVSGMGSGACQPGRGVDLSYARVSATRQSLERQLKARGHTLGQVAARTGIPNTSLHRYLASGVPEAAS